MERSMRIGHKVERDIAALSDIRWNFLYPVDIWKITKMPSNGDNLDESSMRY